MNTTPSKGLNTWVGYGLSLLMLLAGALLTGLQATDVTDQPVWVQLALTALGTALAGLTGKTRSDQAIALTNAASTERMMKPPMVMAAPVGPDDYRGRPAISDSSPMTPAELDAVDLPDSELVGKG